VVQSEPTGKPSLMRQVFGVVSGRSCWGLEPWDLRPMLGLSKLNADIEQGGSQAHTTREGNDKFYHCPKKRHVWGHSQYALHASWGELFMDLIFVGAAFRLGILVKTSFCDLDPDGSGSGSGSGPGSSSSSSSGSVSSSGSAADSGGCSGGSGSGSGYPGMCAGPAIGVLFAVGFFFVLLRTWLSDLHYRARFAAGSRVHIFLDVLNFLMQIYAAGSIGTMDECDSRTQAQTRTLL
jgi:hypothetical protein